MTCPMFTLRLFHQGQPFTQIEARELSDASLTVGRDEAAGWRVEDESRTLSRLHCTFSADGDRLILHDSSANGVFVGPERRRVAARADIPIFPGETIRLGDYILLVEGRSAAGVPLKAAGEAPRAPAADASLMEAFCQAAGLDASAFSDEEPAAVMHRLGGVYRQMVIGLAGLMQQRIEAKAQYALERTTVGAGGNNPFRWATPDRVAVDLLRPRDDGFLSGAAAVESSFADLQHHLICTVAGAKGAVTATLHSLDPASIEDALSAKNFVLKGRGAEAWSRYIDLYAKAVASGPDDPDSVAATAFRHAYARQDDALQDGTK